MLEPSLAGKTFMVTAAAAGIGLATSKLLLESGANVGMSDEDGEALGLIVSSFDPEVRSRVLTGVVDVSIRSAVREFIQQIRAGILVLRMSGILKMPGIMDRPGSIVTVGSEYSFKGSKGTSLYAASKHGLLGMVKGVALETGAGDDGVRINAVLPGPTDTPARRTVMELVGKERDSTKRRPLGRPADPTELAEIILFLLSQKSSVVTGAAWTADGGPAM